MGAPKYRVDDEGNLVEEGSARTPVEEAPITREQARSTVRILSLAEFLGVLMLLGAAVYYEDLRGILIAVTAAYAVVAVFVVLYLRRLLYRRVESNPFG
jgi:Flp pilus assembly protein TadB